MTNPNAGGNITIQYVPLDSKRTNIIFRKKGIGIKNDGSFQKGMGEVSQI